jgi:O-ureido-D-serine cyclo-ligase
MPRIALVTAAAARARDDDLAPLLAALLERGADVEVVDWDDATADWSRFDLALLRSTWDYTERLPEFLDWATRAAACTQLLNPLAVLRWNVDKHYLGELADAGVPIVPSTFVEPHADAADALDAFLGGDGAACAEFVVKPCVGAGSRDAQRHARSDHDAALAHLRRLLAAGRSALLQPYLERVDEHGESALIHFDGAFSHAIRKGPLLRRGDAPTDALFAAESITPRTPDAAERAVADRALAAVAARFSAHADHGSPRSPVTDRPYRPPRPDGATPLLYARVDLIHEADGAPHLLELELAEPSLFFAHAPGSAQRFARCVLARVPPGGASSGQGFATAG